MRRRRFANGSLRLDQTKMHFNIDEDGNPTAASPYPIREANHLAGGFSRTTTRTANGARINTWAGEYLTLRDVRTRLAVADRPPDHRMGYGRRVCWICCSPKPKTLNHRP